MSSGRLADSSCRRQSCNMQCWPAPPTRKGRASRWLACPAFFTWSADFLARVDRVHQAEGFPDRLNVNDRLQEVKGILQAFLGVLRHLLIHRLDGTNESRHSRLDEHPLFRRQRILAASLGREVCHGQRRSCPDNATPKRVLTLFSSTFCRRLVARCRTSSRRSRPSPPASGRSNGCMRAGTQRGARKGARIYFQAIFTDDPAASSVADLVAR